MTDSASVFQTARLSRDDGFALLELLIGIVILTMMTLLTLRVSAFTGEAYYTFPERYTRFRSEALLTGSPRVYEDDTEMDYPMIRLGENGTVNQARTLVFPCGNRRKEIVIELGTGSLVFR
jgi:prepilin-type N-terminal cleavage/methylation domain-containing protein